MAGPERACAPRREKAPAMAGPKAPLRAGPAEAGTLPVALKDRPCANFSSAAPHRRGRRVRVAGRRALTGQGRPQAVGPGTRVKQAVASKRAVERQGASGAQATGAKEAGATAAGAKDAGAKA